MGITSLSAVKPPFVQQIPIIEEQTKRRRPRWTLHSYPFEDVIQDITIHACEKYDSPTGGFRPELCRKNDTSELCFLKWINRLISRQMANILRNHYSKWQRPCIKCAFNTGDGSCSKTPSRRQCDECTLPEYRKWLKSKQSQFNIQQTLPLENHSQEVENYQGDFFDVAAAKKIVDAKMKERLTKYEWRVYRMLYIQHKSETEVGIILKLKKVGRTSPGYQRILSLRKHFATIARQIVEEENLA